MPCLLLPTSHCMVPLQPREYTISIFTCVHCRCLWQELQLVPERPLCMGSLKWFLLLLPLLARSCERRVTLSKHRRRHLKNHGIESLHWATFIALALCGGGMYKIVHLKFHKTGQEKHGFNLPGNLITSRKAPE